MSSILTYLRSFRRHAEPSESDGELLRRFRIQRDEQAFAALVHRHGPMVLAIARRMIGATDLTEDVFQATFLVAAQRAKQLEDWSSIAGWLMQVTRRTALQAKAKAARRFRHEQQAAAMMTSTTTAEPTQVASHRDVAELLDFELSRLPGKYRTPLVLCHLQGRTKEEAAQQLGWPVGSVSGRLARAKQLLKARLLRRGVVPTLATGILSVPRLEAGIPPLLVQATTLLASSIVHKAYPIPASAAVALAQGVMTSMFLTKLKWAVAALVILSLSVTGGVWAWTGTAASFQDQSKAPTITSKPATLLEQLQGLWVLDDANGTGPYLILPDGSLRSAHKWWQFTDSELQSADTLDLLNRQPPHKFELDESKVPTHFDWKSPTGWPGILKLKDGKLVIKLGASRPADFERSEKSTVYTFHRANDYDRLEGIWRKETRNPVTDELESVNEYIFRKNLCVSRWYNRKNTDKEIHFVNENPPVKFELHQDFNPKGFDWNIVSAKTLEEQHSATLNEKDTEVREANLKNMRTNFSLNERSLGIYELSPNEFRLFIRGYVPFEVEGNHFVANPNSPNAKRPTSFAEAGENLQVYKRVDRSLKDLPGSGSSPQKDPNSTAVEPASNSIPSAPQPSQPSPKLQDLRQQRLKLAQERMDLARQEYQAGRISLDAISPMAEKLVEARLAVAKDKKEKLQALEEQLQLVKQIAQLVEDRYKAAGCPRSDVVATQLRRIELEIQIEELKAQP